MHLSWKSRFTDTISNHILNDYSTYICNNENIKHQVSITLASTVFVSRLADIEMTILGSDNCAGEGEGGRADNAVVHVVLEL